jgi:polynucleotide 5'-hydroxyl-kinase GRC3/NOL9
MNKKLDKGVYIISGPVEFELKLGKIFSIGKKIVEGEKIFVPEGKRIPLEVTETSEILLEKDVELTFLSSRTIPDDWDKVVDYIISQKKKFNKPVSLLVFGEVDTGKTFFSTYLTNRFIEHKLSVSVLDCDTGQSDIGLPGSLGLAVFKEPILFMADTKPDSLAFLGSHSPSEHFLHYASGFVKTVNYGIKNSDILIIDTPGWVQSDGGRALRRTEIEILQGLDTNYFVVLLQRGDELEHLVKGLKEEKIVRLTVSKKASPTSVEERKKLREFIYKKYFVDAKSIELDFDKIFTDRGYLLSGEEIKEKVLDKKVVWIERLSNWEGIFVVGKQLLVEEVETIKSKLNVRRAIVTTEDNYIGMVSALLDENCDVVGFCMIEKVDFVNKKFVILTPEYNLKDKIKGIQFGSIKIKSSGEENGFVEPGTV